MSMLSATRICFLMCAALNSSSIVSTAGHVSGTQTQDVTSDGQSGRSRSTSSAPPASLCALVGTSVADEASDLLAPGKGVAAVGIPLQRGAGRQLVWGEQ